MLVKRINFEQLGEHCYEEMRNALNGNINNFTIALFESVMKRIAPCSFRAVRWVENDDLEPGELIVAVVVFDSIDDWIFFKMRTEI